MSFISLSSYITELAIVCTASGIICILGERLRGGVGNFIKLASALVIALFTLSPIVSLENGQLDLSLPTSQPSATGGDYGEFNDMLISATVKSLNQGCIDALCTKYSLSTDDVGIEFSASIEDERFVLSICRVTVKSLKSLAQREAITAYIYENFGCECEVIEDLGF